MPTKTLLTHNMLIVAVAVENEVQKDSGAILARRVIDWPHPEASNLFLTRQYSTLQRRMRLLEAILKLKQFQMRRARVQVFRRDFSAHADNQLARSVVNPQQVHVYSHHASIELIPIHAQ